MFLIRVVFWMSLVIAFIPVNPNDLGPGQRPVTTKETIGAVQMTVSDLGGFCDRNPQPCDTGRELFSQFGAKAKNGAHFVHEFLGERLAREDFGKPARTDAISTGSVDN